LTWQHGFAGLQPPAVDQALVGGPGADHEASSLGETHPAGQGSHADGSCQRQFRESAARREEAPVNPVARLKAGARAGRCNHAGDFLARHERQGKAREAAADEPDVPGTYARTVDPDQHLSCRGHRIWQFRLIHAVDPAELCHDRCSHGCGLLTPWPTLCH
jgi:hypothetical protein